IGRFFGLTMIVVAMRRFGWPGWLWRGFEGMTASQTFGDEHTGRPIPKRDFYNRVSKSEQQ
ncbi:MAG TPA: hypothetical protein VE715_13295, partial [Blastocatellia bacterium]|nr:hypothetical protein [Blastocatellia bacterium]